MGGLVICHSSCVALAQLVIYFNEPASKKEKEGGVFPKCILNAN